MSANSHRSPRPLPGVGFALLMLSLLALAFILDGVESTPALVLACAVALAPASYFTAWVRRIRAGGQA